MTIQIDLITVAPLMAVVLIVLLINMRRTQKRSISYLLCFSIFAIYLLYVLKYTMFPLRLFDHDYAEMMKDWGIPWFQLIPFRDVSLGYLLSPQGYGNVLLTVPFGFGSPFLLTTDLRRVAWRGLLLTVSIESIQLLLNVIYGYRVRLVDVNDIMFNFIGALIGYGLFRMAAWLYRKVVPESTVVPRIWKHMHTVSHEVSDERGAARS